MKYKKVVPPVVVTNVINYKKLWWYKRSWLKIAPVPFKYTGPDPDQKIKIIKEAGKHFEGDKKFLITINQ